ncbi:bacterial Ig-like domain-containing protein [Lactobacillus sp. ESL0785]|uniref:bacterial Ig-like domain-containing protein n=1 Tax=Lactobacillus sp. ESL0785 TaxID=2983232 RepID=UPI0023F8910E|nr:bacterial Ig-like domain-containing protein [Lactobacillus sp. ESL0785]WEV71398.1 bacterial Ig-like domain-containing protein [Lactobacillus sp. ESL0785]
MNSLSKKSLLLVSTLAATSLFVWGNYSQTAGRSYHKAVTKIAGSGNYTIYHHVSKKGPSGGFTSTKYFKHADIQSKRLLATHQGKYWQIIVDGRTVGWVNQHFFACDKIAVAKKVSLVQDASSFNTRDAISFATDSQGTSVDTSKIKVSKAKINTSSAGTTTVNYQYGKAKASVNVTVRADKDEGIARADQTPKNGPKAVATWKGSSKSSSRNWNARHHFTSETRSNTFRASDLTLKTELFQPRFISLDYNKAADRMGQVGVIPEGISVKNNQLTVSVFSSSSDQRGHLVTYEMGHLNKYRVQNLQNLGWPTFKNYAAHIRVSPYIKLGHGQSIGATNKYIYVMANDNKVKNASASEEILQVRKSDMQINKLWSFRISNGGSPRYIHNATFANDHTMYCLFHNGGNNRYEYWKVTRNGDTWTPVEVGATQSNFISNGSPVQGFAYDARHDQFYLGFNDYLFRIAKNGNYRGSTHLHVKREIEGVSVSGKKLYVEFAQRGELTVGNTK